MSLKNLYNESFRNSTLEFSPSKGLLNLLEHKLALDYLSEKEGRPFDVLECGCGPGSHFAFWGQKPMGTSVNAFDWSEVVIEKVKSLEAFNEVNFDVFEADSFSYPLNFDFILDAHLFHCLIEKEQRKNYLEKIKFHLKPGGFFFSEMMISHKGLYINDNPEVSLLDDLLYYQGQAQRYVPHSLDLEKELIESGLKIEFFTIPYGLRMVPIPYREKALSGDPEVVRVIMRKV
ncbi:MAG: class I SAM-dependent methyltransferase [Bacteriovoracaceae bacterium]